MWNSKPLAFAALLASQIALGVTTCEAATTQTYQDWHVDCPQANACVAHFDAEGVQILLGRAAPNAAMRMAFRFPAATKSGTPIAMRLSTGWQAGLRIAGCKKEYCEAAVAANLTDSTIAQLRRSQSGEVAYLLNDRILIIPFSLSGFADAIKAVSS